jgi:hypothetical protein
MGATETGASQKGCGKKSNDDTRLKERTVVQPVKIWQRMEGHINGETLRSYTMQQVTMIHFDDIIHYNSLVYIVWTLNHLIRWRDEAKWCDVLDFHLLVSI